jgi:Protein of unknown function (DUF3311)
MSAAMSGALPEPVPGRGPARRWRSRSRILPALCLLVPFAALLWVPMYAGGSPRLFGVPFFYWYQLAWVFGTPVFMGVAYALRRRAAVGGRS